MPAKKSPGVVFTKEFTKQEPIPEEGIRRAVALMESGRLHRYNVAQGETSEVALLETEFAAYIGTRYCAALSSCGSALYVALKCAGVTAGDKVLCNAFTLAPVPGAIDNAGAEVVLVGITPNYTVDLTDLEEKMRQSGARFFLISHMRGHIADMERVAALCSSHGVTLIEDCAHTMGGAWAGRPTGTFGAIGCFSTQTYKHMNSGEGGLLVTNDDDIAAKAILYSGSYMLYSGHLSGPPLEVFERHRLTIPNFSLRMSNLQAALLRPQLRRLDDSCRRWNERYDTLTKALTGLPHLALPCRDPREKYVGSSFQFSLVGLQRPQAQWFIEECGRRGVEIKWFGWREPKGFTSTFRHWQYLSQTAELSQTEEILDWLCDFRVPLTFSLDDCLLLANVIGEVMDDIEDETPSAG
jgi:dTDP-4-amino-4,6-dideoxygalactose transaminase